MVTQNVVDLPQQPGQPSCQNSRLVTYMDLSRLSHELDKGSCQCRVVVETPKGCRNKFAYDPDIEAFTLGGLLAEGLSFPYDFGFIPSTRGQDGDPST